MTSSAILNDRLGIDGPSLEEIKEAKPKRSIALGVLKFSAAVLEAVSISGVAFPSLMSGDAVINSALLSFVSSLGAHVLKLSIDEQSFKEQQANFVDEVVKTNPERLSLDELGRLICCEDGLLKKLSVPLRVDVIEAQRDYALYQAQKYMPRSKRVQNITNTVSEGEGGRDENRLARLTKERDGLIKLMEKVRLPSEASPVEQEERLSTSSYFDYSGRPSVVFRLLGNAATGIACSFVSFLSHQIYSGFSALSGPLALSALLLKNDGKLPSFKELPSFAAKIAEIRAERCSLILHKPTGPQPS